MPTDKTDDERFGVFIGNSQSQATVVTIPPGESQGGPEHRRRETDQWLFVVDGDGIAIVEDDEIALVPGALLLIEAGNAHEIKNTGSAPLKAINVYVPSAYDGLSNGTAAE